MVREGFLEIRKPHKNNNAVAITGAFLLVPVYLVPILFHSEVGASMLHEHVILHEGLGVQQQLDPLPRRQLTLPRQEFKVNPATTRV